MNDLYWTVIPLMALYHYTLIALRFVPQVNTFRLGLMWGILLLWSLRLTYNYIRREEWSFGAREDFRFERFREQYGRHWLYLSIFMQYISQHVTEVLFTIPYYFILRDAAPSDKFDILCVILALCCLIVAGIADEELRDWVLNPKNRNRVLKSGLWSVSRHPNYFAESTFHWCFGLWALRSAPSYWILVCPAFNTLILIITTQLTEARFLRGKKRKEYLEYQKTVRVW
jgi:steroid 5-alpha reductase family enzyme